MAADIDIEIDIDIDLEIDIDIDIEIVIEKDIDADIEKESDSLIFLKIQNAKFKMQNFGAKPILNVRYILGLRIEKFSNMVLTSTYPRDII